MNIGDRSGLHKQDTVPQFVRMLSCRVSSSTAGIQWLYAVALYSGSFPWFHIVAVYSGSIHWCCAGLLRNRAAHTYCYNHNNYYYNHMVNVYTTDDFSESVDALAYSIASGVGEMNIAYPNLFFYHNFRNGLPVAVCLLGAQRWQQSVGRRRGVWQDLRLLLASRVPAGDKSAVVCDLQAVDHEPTTHVPKHVCPDIGWFHLVCAN